MNVLSSNAAVGSTVQQLPTSAKVLTAGYSEGLLRLRKDKVLKAAAEDSNRSLPKTAAGSELASGRRRRDDVLQRCGVGGAASNSASDSGIEDLIQHQAGRSSPSPHRLVVHCTGVLGSCGLRIPLSP